MGHKAEHISFHCCRSEATLAAISQLLHPMPYRSFSTILLHVSFHLPLFLFPSGAHCSATLLLSSVFLLRIWPIYFQRLLLTVSSIDVMLAFSLNPLLLNFVGQKTFIIHRMHLF